MDMFVDVEACFRALDRGFSCRLGRRCFHEDNLLLLGFGGEVLFLSIISSVIFRTPLHHIHEMRVD
jgi:hypothetical protein